MQEESLHVCLWTVWPFEKLVDFGSVHWSEAFAGRRKMFVTRTGKSCSEQDLPGGFDWLSFCPRSRKFLDERLCLQGIHGVQAIEGLTMENSLVRLWGVSWNLSDGSAEMNQVIERSGGIEGGSIMNIEIIREDNQSSVGRFRMACWEAQGQFAKRQ